VVNFIQYNGEMARFVISVFFFFFKGLVSITKNYQQFNYKIGQRVFTFILLKLYNFALLIHFFIVTAA